MSKPIATQHAWQSQARRVALQVNIAWWLQRLAAPLMLGTLVGTAALLWFRRQHPEISVLQWLGMIAIGISIIGAICAFLVRKNFETTEQSMVRIEAAMCLRCGLSAAMAGVAPWPDVPEKVHAGLRWHWQRVLLPPLAALLLLGAGLLIPLHRLLPAPTAPDQPQAWERTESELSRLEEEKVVDQEYIEEVRKKIEDLRAQDPQEWFSHASMEATDNMRKEHKAEAKRLEREMSQAAKALETLQSNPQLGQKEKSRLANEFDQAMQGMQSGAMKPNPALLEQLKGMDPNQLDKLNSEQLQQLQQNLKKNAEQLKGQGQQSEGGQGDEWLDELLADGSDSSEGGKCQGQGEGEGEGDGDKPGRGGINRGPGHDPNLLGKASQELETGDMQGLKATDLSRSLPGDLLEVQDGKHDVDTSASKISGGGDVTDTGKGGDRVWRDSLDPQEQKALKKFFE
ncbi:MAG: hypothetical protein ACOVRB_04420 [Akkermansiaceae bacterium]